MATVYLDLNASTNGSGSSSSDPFNSSASAESGAGAGGTIIYVADTTQNGDDDSNGYFDFDANVILEAETSRKVTLTGGNQAAYVARYSDPISSSFNPVLARRLVVDGSSKSSATTFENLSATGVSFRQEDMEYISGSAYGINYSNRDGSIELVSCKISGSPTSAMFATSPSLSNDGDQTVTINGLELDGTISSGLLNGVQVTKVNNLTNTLALDIKAVDAKLTATGSGNIAAINVKTVNPTVSNCNLTIDGLNTTGTGHFGILAQGQSTAIASLPIISNNIIDFKCNSGYGIALGQSDVASNITGGQVSGNYIKGVYSYTDTPHAFSVGQGVAGSLTRGNTAQDTYVGYLLSKCTSSTIEGNLAFDCFGVSYYVKGTTDITIQENAAVVTNSFAKTANTLGVLAVAPQGATNTANATIRRNLVIIESLDNINSLSYLENSSQTASFSNNTYIIPDTIDVDTVKLFNYKNGAGGAANNTIAEWNAQSEVTDDVVVQLPLAEIQKRIESLRPLDATGSVPRAVTYISSRTEAATSSSFTLQPSQELQVFAAPDLEENEYVTIEVDDAIQGWRSMGVVVNQFDSNGFIQNNKRVAQQYRLTKSATRSSTRIESN